MRAAAWEAALYDGSVPGFVVDRLAEARSGKSAWVSTMTPAELLIARTHGVRPIATVSGNCWMKITYGANWFGLAQGHAEGWNTALARVEQEAIAAQADAVVDLRLVTQGRHSGTGGVEFSVIGTAVKIAGMPARPARPVLATVPALEFVKMVDSGVVPKGVAVGASGDMFGGYGLFAGGGGGYGGRYGGGASWGAQQQLGWQSQSWFNQPLTELTDFWERIRREAIANMGHQVGSRGNGVLAHSHRSRLIRIERDKQPPDWVGEHIVIGTVVDASEYRNLSFDVGSVIDLRDSSPLGSPSTQGNVYPQHEEVFEL